MATLFLDIDGVLNGHEWIHRKRGPKIIASRAEIAADLFDQVPEVQVVLCSTWGGWIHSGKMTPEGFGRVLESHGIRCNVVEALKDIGTEEKRKKAILQWLDAHPGEPYCVLDDMDLQLSRQIRPNPGIGIEPHHITKAKELLAMPR